MKTVPLSSPLSSPFDRLRWNARELADAVPLRLHALFADGLVFAGSNHPAANDTRASAPRPWSQAYACRRDLPARIRIHN